MEKNLKFFLFLMILNHQGKLADAADTYCYEKANLCGLHESIRSCEVYQSPVVRVENASITFNSLSSPALNITSREFYYIPLGIVETFTKLQCLTIKDSKLKRVRAYNLKPFIYLEYLDLSYNDLLVLEPNLFQHNPNLTQVWLNNNQIYYTDPTALIALKNIKYFNFYNNTCSSFLSKSYEELMLHQYVTLCSNKIPKNLASYDDIIEVKKMISNLSSQVYDLKANSSNKYLKYIIRLTNLVFLVVNSMLIALLFYYLSSPES